MKKNNFKTIIELFLRMIKIGLFTFGGGYAMIALLENEFVEKKKWLEKDEFLNLVGICESTPGPIAINMATYIGYKIGKFFGSLFATIGVCIPSFVIIFIISMVFERFISLEYVDYAFKGIQVCVTFLVFSAGIRMLRKMEKTFFNFLIFFGVLALIITFSLLNIGFSTIYYILICGILGVFVYLISNIKHKEKE